MKWSLRDQSQENLCALKNLSKTNVSGEMINSAQIGAPEFNMKMWLSEKVINPTITAHEMRAHLWLGVVTGSVIMKNVNSKIAPLVTMCPK